MDATTVGPDLLLEATGIRKSFHGVEVLHGVDFGLRRGEVHGLVGQNGAGKSTLMKILNGVYARDAGEIRIGGGVAEYDSAAGAREHGIAMVFQEFSLIPTMTVAQNVLLTREPRGAGGLIDDGAANRRTREVLGELGVVINPKREVGRLAVGSRQLVEIAKALSQETAILILDEPTASLTVSEIETLFASIRRLTAKGIAIVYISHHLREVIEICDRVTVLRDGAVTLSAPTHTLSLPAVVRSMLGASLETELRWQDRSVDRSRTPLLRASGLCLGERVRDVSFDLHAGEVLGIAGLLGSGRTELFRVLFGIDRPEAGSLEIDGKRVTIGSPGAALRRGMALVPEDRRRAGLVPEHSVRANVLMAAWRTIARLGLVRDREGDRLVVGFVERLKIRTPGLRQQVNRLSGGNQQKVVVAKYLTVRPRVLLLDDPTVGIDVRSKADILDEVRTMAEAGTGIILVSSEFEELAAVADRVMLLRDGAVAGWLDRSAGDDLSEEGLSQAIQAA